MYQWGRYKHGRNLRSQKVGECLISHKAYPRIYSHTSLFTLVSGFSQLFPYILAHWGLCAAAFSVQNFPHLVDYLSPTCPFVPSWDVASSRKASLTHTKTEIIAVPTLCPPAPCVCPTLPPQDGRTAVTLWWQLSPSSLPCPFCFLIPKYSASSCGFDNSFPEWAGPSGNRH